MNRAYRFGYGLLLTSRYVAKLPLSVFENKRVAVVGPASSAFNTSKGEYIDGFDVIVRVNKSAGIVHQGRFKNDIGSRTTVLFHNFFENGESGGGPLDLAMFDAQGVAYLVNPRNTFGGIRNSLNFFKKYLVRRQIYTLPSSTYRRICGPLRGFKPTIGFTALSYLVGETQFSELYITGFTFYRTPFGEGYRDHIKDPDKAKAFISEHGIHNIDLEFGAFMQLVNTSDKRIIFDSTLEKIIKNESLVS